MSDCRHGHVWPRQDGGKARCGGPTICRHCATDLAAKLNSPPVELPPAEVLQSVTCILGEVEFRRRAAIHAPVTHEVVMEACGFAPGTTLFDGDVRRSYFAVRAMIHREWADALVDELSGPTS